MILALGLVLCFTFSCQKGKDVVKKETEPAITIDNAISADGVSIAYEVRGEGEPTLVFVHGWTNSRRNWEDEVAHFSKNYRVAAIDLAGAGASGHNREKWTMSAFGEDVVAVMRKAKLDNAVLIGFSMGGTVILEAAKRIPELVIGLVIVDFLKNIEDRYTEETIAKMERIAMDWVNEPTIEKAQGFFERNKKELSEKLNSTIIGVSTVGWSESYKNMWRWCNDECIENLQTIHAPVTSINSDRGTTNVEAFRKYVPSFKAKIIKGVGHGIYWEAPEEFRRLLEETIQEFVQMKQER